MIEVLKHFFGVCGDGHVNIFTILGLSASACLIRCYVKYYYDTLKVYVKTCLSFLNVNFFRNKKQVQ